MADWDQLLESIRNCSACPLRGGCIQTVPGEGNRNARLMLIGEGPGQYEDEQGRPFVGASGMLLEKMLAAIGFRREDVYIANIVKCRPPHNRAPLEEEAQACLPYLRAQTSLIRPSIILMLGATAARYTISSDVRIRRDHGQWTYRKGVWMMPTYHPSALLRDVSLKREAWSDLQAVRAKYDELFASEEREYGQEHSSSGTV